MCTGIKIDYKDGCVIGRTMDFEVPLNYNASYLPRNYKFCDDLEGNAMYTKYKTLGMCFEDRVPLKDGVNEHGLVGITNAFSGFNLYPNEVKPGKKNISSLNYLTYALSNYKTVEDVIKDLPNLHMSSRDSSGEKVLMPDFHYMFTDSTKKTIVVEPKNRKLIYHENPYDVMTNSPHFESHVKRLNKFFNLDNLEDFNSSKNLPGGYDPCSRFIKAYFLTKMNEKANTSNEALSNFYNIASAMVMPKGFVINKKYNEITYTRYICAYDTNNKILNVKTHRNPTVYQLGFEDIENENERQSFFLNKDFIVEKLK